MFYIILIVIVALIIYAFFSSNSQTITPSEESEFSLTRPFSQAAIDYSKQLPSDIVSAIDKYQHITKEINSNIGATIRCPSTSQFSFDIFATDDRIFFKAHDEWSDLSEFQIVNFKNLGYEVYDSTKLEGIVYACFRKIHNECLRGNEKVDHYYVSDGGTSTVEHWVPKYAKCMKQRQRLFRLVVTVKKPPEPELRKL